MFIIWNLELILVYAYLISLLITIVSANFDYRRRWVVGIGCLTDWYCQSYAIFLWICGGRVGRSWISERKTDR